MSKTFDVLPPAHPAASRFPMLGKSELQELADDIRRHGQIHPIVIFEDRMLDGRNRAAACRLANVEPKTVVLETCESPTAYIISANIRRRHLSGVQRSAMAVDPKILECYRREAKARQKEHGGTAPGKRKNTPSGSKRKCASAGEAIAAAAEAFEVGRDSAYTMLQIQREAPEVYDDAKGGKFTSVAEAKRVAEGKAAGSVDPRVARRKARDDQILAMTEEGVPVREQAKRLGCNETTVQQARDARRVVKDRLPPPPFLSGALEADAA